MIQLIRQCSLFRDLISAATRREFKSRFRGTIFGPLWIFMHPLMYLGVYFTVFVKLLQAKGGMEEDFNPEHPLFARFSENPSTTFALAMFTALVPWFALTEAVGRSANAVNESGSLIKKFAFPAEILQVPRVLVGMATMSISFIVVGLGVFAVFQTVPRLIWLLPIVIVLQGIFTLGLCYLISAVGVYIKDVAQFLPMLITLWFFTSPIFYTRSITSEFSWLLDLNPVTYMVELYRSIFILYPGLKMGTESGDVPWTALGRFAGFSLFYFILGQRVFMKLKPGFADEV